MYAIVAFKRDLTHHSDPAKNTQEVLFEIRTYGCFNGFNTPTAFLRAAERGGNSTDDLTCILSPHTGAGRMKEYATSSGQVNESWSPAVELNSRRMFALGNREQKAEYERQLGDFTTGDWSCLGIGWMSYKTGEVAPGGGSSSLQPGYSQPGMVINDVMIGNALQHEGFIERYYDGYNGGMLTTRRVLTANEKFLSDLCAGYQDGSHQRKYLSNELCKWSRMATSIQNNRHFSGSLYQMVGSERSSGSAVAYLQMFRNTAEYQISGWAGAKLSIASMLTRIILPMLGERESRVAILDYFTHHGDDSSIISFASNQFGAHVTKYGYFESDFLFRRTDSMLIEGRYNKGGQSSEIVRKIRNALSSRNSGFSQSLEELSSFSTAARHAHDLSSMVNYSSLKQNREQVVQSRPAPTPENIPTLAADRLLNSMRSTLTAYFRFDPASTINSWLTAMHQFPDLRAPTTPVTRADGAAQGFREWVATADTIAANAVPEVTIH